MVEHPNYNENTDEYDMGLLFLEASTMMDITYPTLNNDANYPSVGTTTHVMGWGDTDAGTNQKVSDHLLIVDLEVISNSDCSRMERAQDGENISYSGWIFDDMLCTFSPGQDACQGDSGKLNIGWPCQLDCSYERLCIDSPMLISYKVDHS